MQSRNIKPGSLLRKTKLILRFCSEEKRHVQLSFFRGRRLAVWSAPRPSAPVVDRCRLALRKASRGRAEFHRSGSEVLPISPVHTLLRIIGQGKWDKADAHVVLCAVLRCWEFNRFAAQRQWGEHGPNGLALIAFCASLVAFDFVQL